MKNLSHHHASASRCAVLAVGLALLASCASTDTTTSAAPIEGTALDAVAASGYTINAGDTLSSIASRAGIAVSDIVAINGWSDGNSHLILPGDVIQLPGGTTVEPPTSNPAAGSAAQAASSTPTPSTRVETQPWNCELAKFDETLLVGGNSLTLHEVGCAEGWAVGYYGEYDEAAGNEALEPSGHVILKADGQRWIKQDPNTVCNGLSPVPSELRWLCVGG